jgi:small conductance mechanosensitive channel
MMNREVDPSLIPFLKSLLGALLKIALFVSIASMVGLEMTSFIAILGAAGLAVGLALQGTLANFAGGVMILLFKPFKVGDVVEAQGYTGAVKEIQIFNTIMTTPENKIIIIPNGGLANSAMTNYITNYTIEGKIRVDMTMGISYESDIKAARKALMEVMEAHPKILKSPAPFVGVVELADSSVNLAVRPYADRSDYWEVYFDIYKAGKEALDAANITIPFPQMDVHLNK